MRNLTSWALPITLLGVFVGCSDDGVDSDEEARRAYLGLDKSIEKSLNLGFAGFNAASSANIAPQAGTGDAAGTVTITGQVDQGSSDNKGMRLYVAMVDYDDGNIDVGGEEDIHIVYDTDPDPMKQPYLNLKLNNFPNGTLMGTLDSNSAMTGVYTMSGDIEGTLALVVTITGPIMAGTIAGQVVRVPGMTTVVGTATNGDGGKYEINLTF